MEGILVIILFAELHFSSCLFVLAAARRVSEDARKGITNRVIPSLFLIPASSDPIARWHLPEQEEELCQMIYQTLTQDAWRKGKTQVVVSRDDITALVARGGLATEQVRARFQAAKRAIKFINAMQKNVAEAENKLSMKYAMQYTGDKFTPPEEQMIVEHGALAYIDEFDKTHQEHGTQKKYLTPLPIV